MNKKTDWTARKNITMPAAMVDSIKRAAIERDLKVYQLVNEAVVTWILLHPLNGDDQDAQQ